MREEDKEERKWKGEERRGEGKGVKERRGEDGKGKERKGRIRLFSIPCLRAVCEIQGGPWGLDPPDLHERHPETLKSKLLSENYKYFILLSPMVT